MVSKCPNITVILGHPHGSIEVPLESWIAYGPGERQYVQPIAVKCADNNQKLPVSIIPLAYRNNLLSPLLIALGILMQIKN